LEVRVIFRSGLSIFLQRRLTFQLIILTQLGFKDYGTNIYRRSSCWAVV